MQGQRDAAIVEYRKILSSDPSDPAALCAVLDDCRARGASAEALPIAERALLEIPDAFIALDAVAWVSIARGEHDKARLVVEKALESLKTSPPARALVEPVPRAMWWMARLLGFLTGLRRLPRPAEASQEAERDLARWQSWAVEYLTWCASERATEPSAPPH